LTEQRLSSKADNTFYLIETTLLNEKGMVMKSRTWHYSPTLSFQNFTPFFSSTEHISHLHAPQNKESHKGLERLQDE